MSCVETRTVELKIFVLKSGRLYATCPEIEGFAAQAKDLTQLKLRVPLLMKKMLEYRGEEIASIEFIEERRATRPLSATRAGRVLHSNADEELGFAPGTVMNTSIAHAEICHSAHFAH